MIDNEQTSLIFFKARSERFAQLHLVRFLSLKQGKQTWVQFFIQQTNIKRGLNTYNPYRNRSKTHMYMINIIYCLSDMRVSDNFSGQPFDYQRVPKLRSPKHSDGMLRCRANKHLIEHRRELVRKFSHLFVYFLLFLCFLKWQRS